MEGSAGAGPRLRQMTDSTTGHADEPISDRARDVVTRFQIEGELVALEPLRRGHIHDTLISTWRRASGDIRYLHQRINGQVFRDVPGLMHNIETVTEHLRNKGGGDHGLQTLELVPSRDGAVYLETELGAWRTYHFIEGASSRDECQGPDQAFSVARAFGWFHASLSDLDPRGLRETIPRFFSSSYRLEQLSSAIAADAAGRASSCGPEIEFAMQRTAMADVAAERLADRRWPERVVHGDTKLNNILFDVDSGEPRCIVDLDTCMPGFALYDFGDLVRFTAATTAEDERDLDKVGMDLELYRALAAGYVDTASSFLTEDELEHMPLSARLVTWTIGARFLADHLAGDTYFKVSREGHNLDRARVQFKLVESMERQEAAMRSGAAG